MAERIDPNMVERRLSHDILDHIAALIEVPPDKLAGFRQSVLAAASTYAEETARPTAQDIGWEIKRLYRAAGKALRATPQTAHDCAEEVATRLERLTPEARRFLEFGRAAPTPAEVRNQATRAESLRLVHGLCVTGAEWKQGRSRPSGKRSRPSLQPRFVGPKPPRRGRPTTDPAYSLCTSLAGAFHKATGRWPTYSGSRTSKFQQLFEAVWAALHGEVDTVSATRAIRRYVAAIHDSR